MECWQYTAYAADVCQRAGRQEAGFHFHTWILLYRHLIWTYRLRCFLAGCKPYQKAGEVDVAIPARHKLSSQESKPGASRDRYNRITSIKC